MTAAARWPPLQTNPGDVCKPHQKQITSATMSPVTAAAQPPPLQMNPDEIRKSHHKRFGLCSDVARHRRRTAATASDESRRSLQAAPKFIWLLQRCR